VYNVAMDASCPLCGFQFLWSDPQAARTALFMQMVWMIKAVQYVLRDGSSATRRRNVRLLAYQHAGHLVVWQPDMVHLWVFHHSIYMLFVSSLQELWERKEAAIKLQFMWRYYKLHNITFAQRVEYLRKRALKTAASQPKIATKGTNWRGYLIVLPHKKYQPKKSITWETMQRRLAKKNKKKGKASASFAHSKNVLDAGHKFMVFLNSIRRA
jgi:hypothetical protein